jgi:hypothetical protein
MNQTINAESPKSLYVAQSSDEFDVTLYNPKTGIEYPAVVSVDYFFEQPPYKGSPLNCDSDSDYYGYIDFDYRILDQYGEESMALTALVTDEQEAEFEATYKEYLESLYSRY